mgnify:CR=1 FL=1
MAGFIGNRLQYALLREALWIVQNEIDSFEAITGPFATADLGGLDTFLMISQQLMPQLASDNSPLKVMERIVSEGSIGAKSGKGLILWPEERYETVVKARNNSLLQRRKEERKT